MMGLRNAYLLTLAGALGAVLGLDLFAGLVGPSAPEWVRGAVAGLLVGGSIGFLVGAARPLLDGDLRTFARLGPWMAAFGAAGGAAGLSLGETMLGSALPAFAARLAGWGMVGLALGLGRGFWSNRSPRDPAISSALGLLGALAGGAVLEVLRTEVSNPGTGQVLGALAFGACLGLSLALTDLLGDNRAISPVAGRPG